MPEHCACCDKELSYDRAFMCDRFGVKDTLCDDCYKSIRETVKMLRRAHNQSVRAEMKREKEPTHEN